MTARFIPAILLVVFWNGVALAAPAPRSMFTDLRPVGVGDLVTILVQENSIGAGDAVTNTDKKASIEGDDGAGFLDLVKKWGIGGRAKFEGTGSTTRNGRLVARLSGRVTELDANGNLVIEASKILKVNQDEQTITVHGVIRPEDVGPNNSVLSSAIAEARIEYSGEGAVTTGQRPGYVMRLLNWLI
ncbi:MAG: flagellar basal body L-ring protein FlgH [bacterium]